MSKLILLRHGQSTWNKENLFTGWVNVGLSEKGIQEALDAGEKLKKENIDVVYVSSLIRAQQTALIGLASYPKDTILINQHSVKRDWQEYESEKVLNIYEDWRLNERFYGDLQGLNKNETIAKYGKKQVHEWRRSFDTPPPNGESLAMTSKRTYPAWNKQILPTLASGKNVLIVAHGNSLRAIIKEIDNLTNSEITKVEIPTGTPMFYKYEDAAFTQEAK